MRLSALVLVLLVAATADAGWHTETLALPDGGVLGRPIGVEVWAPGTFSVTTPLEAVLFVDGRFSRLLPGASAGTFLSADGCFVSVSMDGKRPSSTLGGVPCAASALFPLKDAVGTSYFPMSVKHASGGGAYAVGLTGAGEFALFSTPTGDVQNTSVWSPAPGAFLGGIPATGALAVLRVGDSLHGLMGTGAAPSTDMTLVGGEYGSGWRPYSTTAAGRTQAVELFAVDGGVSPYALVGTTQGLRRGVLDGVNQSFTPVELPDGGTAVSSVSMNVGSANPGGEGFGMALMQWADGGHAIVSAVPAREGSQVGTRWRVNEVLSSVLAGARPVQVACKDARSCVITLDRDQNNLLFYHNNLAPVLSVGPALVEVDEGAFIDLPLMTASDLDGDAVLVTAEPENQDLGKWRVERLDAGGPAGTLGLRVSGGAVCGQELVGTLRVFASDGPNRTAPVELPVYVRQTHSPPEPGYQPVGGSVAAGGQPQDFQALPVTSDAGCALSTSWTELTPGAMALARVDGGTLSFAPPSTLCDADGGLYEYSLEVMDPAGFTNSTRVPVYVEPWGPPPEAWGTDAGVSLDAGETLYVGPWNAHACATSQGFPGVESQWSLAPGESLPAGVTLVDADGGMVGALPVRTGPLGVRAEACTVADFQLVAESSTRGDTHGLSSAPSALRVSVRPNLKPFASGELVLTTQRPAPERLEVTVDSNGLDCRELRGLHASLRLERLDGGQQVADASVSVPGQVGLELPGDCAGGRFLLTGAMSEDGGAQRLEKSVEVVVPLRSAGLEPLPWETALVASCGQQARVRLRQDFPAGACPTAAVHWRQVGGPALQEPSLSGAEVVLTSRDTGLDALVGQTVVMEVTAEGGPGNVAIREHRLPITVEPFVRVRRRTELPAASDTGLVGVFLELLNPTACGVSQVTFVERLRGLTYVPGSAQFNGVPVEVEWSEETGTLTVPGLTLEGEGSGSLTYVARPHLVGLRRMEGEALLRGVPISLGENAGPQVPVSGCGCTSSASGSALLALGALGVAVRRRRRRVTTGRS